MQRYSTSQVLSTSYGDTLTIPRGAKRIAAGLADSVEIAYYVQDQANTDDVEMVPAGAGWEAGNGDIGLTADLEIKARAATGTPRLTLTWWR